MSLLEKFNKNRAINSLELMVEIDDKKHKKIYVGSDRHRFYLKSFCGDFDYRKFLVEAVLLRMMADKNSIKKVNQIYRRLYDSLKQIEQAQNLE